MTFDTPAASAPSHTFSEPMMLTIASCTGCATDDAHVDLGREVEDDVGPAVRDEIDHRRRRHVEPVERELVAGQRRARRRGSPSEPVERSSTTSTRQPSASSRSTSVEPMNPAPPVTSAFIAGTLPRSGRDSGGHSIAGEPAAAGDRDARADDRLGLDARTSGSSTASGADDRVARPALPVRDAHAVVQHRAVDHGVALDDRAARRAPTP